MFKFYGLALLVFVSSVFVGFVTTSIVHKFITIMLPLFGYGKNKPMKHVETLCLCPSCQTNLLEKINDEKLLGDGGSYTRVRCTCGKQSLWETMGNPPVLAMDPAESRAKVVAELRKRIGNN